MKHCSAPSVSLPRRTVWRYKFADFERANELLCDLDVNEVLDPSSIQRSWAKLKAIFLDVIEQCIPKSSKSFDPTNYRSISLLSILSKLLEKHMRGLLIHHLQTHCPLSAQQWGFTQGKSTIGALLAATDHWHNLLDSGLEICTVFFDYSKAFDTVPHRRLLQKLESIDIHPLILRWIAHYLYGRSQYVCVGGSSSDLQPVLSGVPQCSVLGPILFIFYINDITSVQLMDGTMSLYADDIMLYRPIYSAIDYHALQIDIDSLCQWTDNNLLTFNAIKCKYMIVSRTKQLTLPITPIMIKDSSLERVDTYKYLGVWLSTTLNWSLQVTEVCKKARRYLGMLYRKFYGYVGPDTFLLFYLTYVRPHLEYAAVVWDPHQQGQITSLENVQKFALRACTRDWKAGYDTLLEKCKIPTLAQRRQFMKLCFMYQVVNQLCVSNRAYRETCDVQKLKKF